MEDQDKIQTSDDVEAHKKKIKATDDDAGEGGSDEFELHKHKIKATDDGSESSDDDVELHKRRS